MDNEKLKEIFAERLRELMDEKEISCINELSIELSIPRPTISRWLARTRSVQIDSGNNCQLFRRFC